MKSNNHDLKQSCPYGLTENDLLELFGEEGLERFCRWMSGQSVMLCDGIDRGKPGYFADNCADSPHGMVAYRADVERYLRDLPVAG